MVDFVVMSLDLRLPVLNTGEERGEAVNRPPHGGGVGYR